MQGLPRRREDCNNNISRNRTVKQWITKATPCRYWSMGIQCPFGNSCWYGHEQKEIPRIHEHLTFAPMSCLYENGLPSEHSNAKDRSGRRMRTATDKLGKSRNNRIPVINCRRSFIRDAKTPNLDTNISRPEAAPENNTSTSSDSDAEQKVEGMKVGSEGNRNLTVHAKEGVLLEELRDITPYDVLQEKDARSDLSICCLYASGGECLLGDSCYFMHPTSQH